MMELQNNILLLIDVVQWSYTASSKYYLIFVFNEISKFQFAEDIMKKYEIFDYLTVNV